MAATIATVDLDADYDVVEIYNRGADEVYFRVDGSAPAVGGDDSYVVPAASYLQVPVVGVAANTSAQLISSGTPPYSVTGVL